MNSEFWLTPPELYKKLDAEFHFDFDPCPYPFKEDAINIEWGNMNYVNPPYRKADAINGHGPTSFVRKAIEQQGKGKTSVMILPILSMHYLLFMAKAEIRPIPAVRWISAKTGFADKKANNCALFILRPL